MASTSVARETITRKALRLFPELTIESLGSGQYFVESESKPDTFYRVCISPFEDVEACDCPANTTCKHLIVATIYRAKVTARRRREVEARREARKTVHANLAPLAGAGV